MGDVETTQAGALERALAMLPAVGDAYRDLAGSLWAPGSVDPVVLELCRLRVCQLVGDAEGAAARTPEAVAAGFDETVAAELPRWPTSPALPEAARPCLEFTEAVVIDPHGVTDEISAALVAALGAPGATGLTMALATFEAASRTRVALAAQGV